MEPVRVLQVVTMMERAGLETMLMNYYRNIDRSKVQFDFLEHRDGAHAYHSEIREMGGNIYKLPPVNPLNTNGYISQLNVFFEEHSEYRIIHSHLDCLSSIPLGIAKKHGVPVRIAHSHVAKMTVDVKYPVRMFFKTLIPYCATDLLACSEAAGRWMYGKHSFSVITNAIDSQKYVVTDDIINSAKERYGVQGKFVVCHVGRFDPVKNHAFLLDVFAEIDKCIPNAVLLLAGEGSTRSQIEEKIEDRGLNDRVRLMGSIADVASFLAAGDVFVFPSLYEGLGISLIEAQASGLQCYASDRVPKGANITGAVQYLPLQAGAEYWAEKIMEGYTKSQAHFRSSPIQLIEKAGYDIKHEAKKLEQIYLDAYGR